MKLKETLLYSFISVLDAAFFRSAYLNRKAATHFLLPIDCYYVNINPFAPAQTRLSEHRQQQVSLALKRARSAFAAYNRSSFVGLVGAAVC